MLRLILAYTAELLHTIRENEEASPPMLDRAHRVFGPRNRPDFIPDILTRVHYFSDKEAILKKAQGIKAVSYNGLSIQIFQDLAPATLQRSQDFKSIMDKLSDLNIKYQWGHPFALMFTWEGKRRVLRSLRDAKQLLQLPVEPEGEDLSSSRERRDGPLRPVWSTVMPPRSKRRIQELESSQTKQDIISHIRSLSGSSFPMQSPNHAD